MKRLLCILLVFTLFTSICVIGVSANSIEEKLAEKFYDYCGGNKIDWNSPNISKDDQKVIIYEYKEVDNIVYFSAVACWLAPGCMGWIETFDKWNVYSPDYNYPSESSLYVLIDDNVFSIGEAWKKGLVTDLTPIEGFSKHTVVTRVENTESEQPTSVLSTGPTQPTSNPLTEPTQPSTNTSADTNSNKEYDFVDNEVIVVLTNEAAAKVKSGELVIDKDYFKSTEFNVTDVECLDLENSARIYLLTLDTHDCENVLRVAELLTAYEDVEFAEPNFYHHIAVSKKSDNPIKVTAKIKIVKLKKLKNKKQVVKAINVKNAKGKVTFKLIKSGITNKIRKLVKINSKGVITINKWKKAKKGTYNIKVTVKAAGNNNYSAKTITKTVKVNIK